MTEAHKGFSGWFVGCVIVLGALSVAFVAHKEGTKQGYEQCEAQHKAYSDGDKKHLQEVWAVEAMRKDVREINAWTKTFEEWTGGKDFRWIGGAVCAKCHGEKPECCVPNLPPCDAHKLCSCLKDCTCCQNCNGSGQKKRWCGCDGCKCCGGCDKDKSCKCGCGKGGGK